MESVGMMPASFLFQTIMGSTPTMRIGNTYEVHVLYIMYANNYSSESVSINCSYSVDVQLHVSCKAN